MRFRANYNQDKHLDSSANAEQNSDPSMTVPDMSLSISEIMRRHVQGRPLPRSRPMFYSGDQEYPNPLSMSEMDMQDYLKVVKDEVEDKTNELAAKRKARKKAIADSKKAGNQQVATSENEVRTESNEQQPAD